LPKIYLPVLHSDQKKALKSRTRFFALRAGRRWGKSTLLQAVGCDAVVRSKSVMYAAPDYKRTSEFFRDAKAILDPIRVSSSETAGVIRTVTKGRMDFWTLNDESAGRSRQYDLVLIDEGAFTKNKEMMGIWEKSIKPTLFDTSGSCIVASNTNGVDTENFLYQICEFPKFGFSQYHAPTHANPLLPKRLPGETYESWQQRREIELKKLEVENAPQVYEQEYLARFVDWSGAAFFARDKMLVGGQPVEYPIHCDTVFAVIDSATKTGKKNDGTAVLFCAYIRNPPINHPNLIWLDYDIQQIEGAMLEHWLPGVQTRLNELSLACKARNGNAGIFIEDKASGMILIQQAQKRGMKVHAIDSKLTSLGKSERAINVSGYYYQEKVKISSYAFNKVVNYKGTTQNHFLTQMVSFRVGSQEEQEDDLLDTGTYSMALSLGDRQGI